MTLLPDPVSHATNGGAGKGAPPPAAKRASAPPAPALLQTPNASVTGQWEQDALGRQILRPLPGVPVHISLLPNGHLLFWGRDKTSGGLDEQKQSRTFLWNPLSPDSEDVKLIHNSTTNLFCSGHSFLQDGRLLVTGGHQRLPPGHDQTKEGVGETHLNVFDYRSEQQPWTKLGTEMTNGRWYPYNLTLENGETVIVSGTFAKEVPSGTGTSFNGAENLVPDIFGHDSSLRPSASASPEPVGTYPHLHLAPDGRVFVAVGLGSRGSRFLDTRTQPHTWTFGQNNPRGPDFIPDVTTSVTYAPGKVLLIGGRAVESVPLPQPLSGTELRILASRKTFHMSLPGPASPSAAAAWTAAAPMQFRRIHHNATLLPDGKVLVTGGTQCPGTNHIKNEEKDENNQNKPCDVGNDPQTVQNGAVLAPELWTPPATATETQLGSWATMAASTFNTPRVYHSTAILLPDGRVFLGGGGLPSAYGETADNEPDNLLGHADGQIFSPPYLFDADGVAVRRRPAITSAPEQVAYGQQFTVGVGNFTADEIDKVVLVRLPSVTHQFGQDQRRMELAFVKPNPSLPPDQKTRLTVTAPADSTDSSGAHIADATVTCPPGPYMMFLLKRNGNNLTPSVAKVITVGKLALSASGQSFRPSPAPGPAPTPADGLQTGSFTVQPSGLAWTASSAGGWLNVTEVNATTRTVTFTVARNTGTSPRQDKITVRAIGRENISQTFTVYQAQSFNDVQENGFAPSIHKISAHGVTSGCGGGAYCPDGLVTRRQMATFIIRALKGGTLRKVQVFNDVPADAPDAHLIRELSLRGITAGCGNGNFCPDDSLTRGQMAVFIIRALGIGTPSPPPPSTDSQPFNDVPPTHPFAAYINEMKRLGITSGCGGGAYCPDGLVTRAQMAVFISQAFGLS